MQGFFHRRAGRKRIPYHEKFACKVDLHCNACQIKLQALCLFSEGPQKAAALLIKL
jgi:hypothetical protein